MKNEKNKRFILIGIFTLVVMVAFSFYVMNGFAWRLRASVYGTGEYVTDTGVVSMSIQFPSNGDNVFFVFNFDENENNLLIGEMDFFARGTYRRTSFNNFIFEGSQIGDFESFSVRISPRNRLVIDVIISGESHRFEGYANMFEMGEELFEDME